VTETTNALKYFLGMSVSISARNNTRVLNCTYNHLHIEVHKGTETAAEGALDFKGVKTCHTDGCSLCISRC
jgi:hypothetical protein